MVFFDPKVTFAKSAENESRFDVNPQENRFIESVPNENSFIAPRASTVQLKEESSNPAKDIKMTIAADKEAEYLSKEYLSDSAVGHSWIMLEKPSGIKDSYGFWPANLGNGGGFDPSEPWKNVAGEVRHPDTSHQPNARHTVNINSSQLTKAEKYADKNKSRDYNLLSYNCTTFARKFFEEAGQSAPSAGMLIEDPNGLYESIEELNGAKGLDANENVKPDKKSSASKARK
ncbi:MAG: hypothetical protein AB8B56_19205 [Crocinitomicaceae bacterium]